MAFLLWNLNPCSASLLLRQAINDACMTGAIR
jgi:hypothetical protein